MLQEHNFVLVTGLFRKNKRKTVAAICLHFVSKLLCLSVCRPQRNYIDVGSVFTSVVVVVVVMVVIVKVVLLL